MQSPEQRREMCCPLAGKICVDGVREDFPKSSVGAAIVCRWWVHMYGKDPQSEKIFDQFDCAVPWLTITTIEGAQMTRQSTATIQEFRNENHEAMAKWNRSIEKAAGALEVMAQQQAEALEAPRRDVIDFHLNGGTGGSPFEK